MRFAFLLITIVIGIPVGTIYRQNIEDWAAGQGLDKLISNGSAMIVANPSGVPLLALFIFALGGTCALWLQHFFRQRFPAQFNIATKTIKNQTFRHQEIVVDGKRFLGCTFDGVTLVYQGTGWFHFEQNKFMGSFSLKVDSKAAEAGLAFGLLSQQLGAPLISGSDGPQSQKMRD
ncbi:MAG: hypothetical protein II336_14700 [Loktanella sp.]|nr:hypothetical protein [Loktanella sp.]